MCVCVGVHLFCPDSLASLELFADMPGGSGSSMADRVDSVLDRQTYVVSAPPVCGVAESQNAFPPLPPPKPPHLSQSLLLRPVSAAATSSSVAPTGMHPHFPTFQYFWLSLFRPTLDPLIARFSSRLCWRWICYHACESLPKRAWGQKGHARCWRACPHQNQSDWPSLASPVGIAYSNSKLFELYLCNDHFKLTQSYVFWNK